MNFLKAVLFEDEDKEEESEKEPLKETVKGEEEVSPEDVTAEGAEDVADDNEGGTEKKVPTESTPDVEGEIRPVVEEGGEGVEEKDGEEDEEEENEVGFGGFGGLAKGWGFGSLVNRIRTTGEQVLNDYREELTEFGLGLKKETEELVDATAHTVKDLPGSLESGAHVAQESLEEVGHTLEEFGSTFWRGTKEIFAQVREAVAAVEEEAALSGKQSKTSSVGYTSVLQRGKYSRYEALVSAMQRDSSTYCDEPEDAEEYATWRSTFSLEDRKVDIDALTKDNAFMTELHSRIVPIIVEYDAFWTRYFYRLHKLQVAEDARATLVKRAATSEEEELSWDVEEEEKTEKEVEKEVEKDSPPEEGKETEGGKGSDLQVEETEEDATEKKEGAVAATAGAPAARDLPEGAEEESGGSDGSTGEWQVVQEEEQGAQTNTLQTHEEEGAGKVPPVVEETEVIPEEEAGGAEKEGTGKGRPEPNPKRGGKEGNKEGAEEVGGGLRGWERRRLYL